MSLGLLPWLRKLGHRSDLHISLHWDKSHTAMQIVGILSRRQDSVDVEVLEILCRAFQSDEHEELNSLRGYKAQIALDIMQEVRKIFISALFR